MLYLVSTPIGNLKDITLRALEVLNLCDYILCEDTRHSLILLKEYNIQKPLKSFHKFNEKKLEDSIIHDLRLDQNIALITDAGSPGICDPGERLIQRCYLEKLPLTAIPGASAWSIALSLCPFSKDHVQFMGFLPKQQQQRKKTLAKALSLPWTTIFYETPHHLSEVLTILPSSRKICILRELTKKFETIEIGTVEECSATFKKKSPKGEFVLIVEGNQDNPYILSPQEHVQSLKTEYGLSQQEAIKICAELRNVTKSSIYQLFCQ